MERSIILTLLLLLVSAACAAARNPSAGLDAACNKTPYAAFCEMLLQPSAGQFADHDPKKMGHAALTATLDRVQSMKSYLVGLGVKTTKSPALKTAVMDCVDRLGRSETSLNAAVKELDSIPAAANAAGTDLNSTAAPVANFPAKAGAVKEIEGATAEAKGCLEALQNAEGGEKKEPGGEPDVTMQAVRQANDTVLACYVAKAFIVMP